MSAVGPPAEPRPPGSERARRIVSLVPSLTEALFALGLGERVVGVTGYCVHPPEARVGRAVVGGTKDVDAERVVALAPDLVIANREENTRRVVEALRDAGLRVWVTYPRTVAEGAELLDALAVLAPAEARAAVVEPVRAAVEAARAARAQRAEPLPRVLCPIWRDPWMVVGPDTYAGDLIDLCGGRLLGGEGADRRYPKRRLEELVALDPDVVLLPDEPYRFEAADLAEWRALDTRASRSGRVHCIDGTWVSWYGPRIRTAIEALAPLLRAPRTPPPV